MSEPEAGETRARELIEKYVDDAYHKAIEFAVIGANIEDPQGGEEFAAAARWLMRHGYQKAWPKP